MIRNDWISNSLGVMGIFLSFYLSTIQLSFLSLFPAIMIASSYSLQTRLRVEIMDERVTFEEKSGMLKYSVFGLAGATLSNYASSFLINRISSMRALAITQVELVYFGAMIAIAEEEFFRGFLVNFIFKLRQSAPLAITVSAMVFSVFHLAVYGTRPDLLAYVFVSGVILGYVAWATQRLSTSMLTHIFVNVLSYSVTGSVMG